VLTLAGHEGGVFGVAWRPDGAQLASAGQDGTVRLWEIKPQEVTVLQTATKSHDTVACSPDGKRLASTGFWFGADALTLWDWPPSAQPTAVLPEKFATLAWSPDSRLLALASDTTVSLRRADTLAETGTFGGHGRDVNALAWSPDGTRLASGAGDQLIKIWDVSAGKEARTLAGHAAAVISLAWSPDGRWLVSGTNGSDAPRLWDVASDQAACELNGNSNSAVFACAWRHDSRQVATTGSDGSIHLWDAPTGQEVRRLTGHTGPVVGLAWLAAPELGRQRLASSGFDGTVRVWDALTGQEILTLRPPGPLVRTLHWSPDGRALLGGNGISVLLWDAGPREDNRQP
jgi:WD40 repeat protein